MTNKEVLLVLEKHISCILNYGCLDIDCEKCEYYVTGEQMQEATKIAIKALIRLIAMEDDLK